MLFLLLPLLLQVLLHVLLSELLIVLKNLLKHVMLDALLKVLLLEPELEVGDLICRRRGRVSLLLKWKDVLFKDLSCEHLCGPTSEGLNPENVFIGNLTILELAEIILVLFLFSYDLGSYLFGSIDHYIGICLSMVLSIGTLHDTVFTQYSFKVRMHYHKAS